MSALGTDPGLAPGHDDVRAIAEEVFASYLGAEHPLLETGPGGPSSTADAAAAAPVVSASVGITGPARASVVVEVSGPAADLVAVTMLALDPTSAPAPEDVADAVGELANMVGGNVKSLLPEPSELSLPVVAGGRVLTGTTPVVDLRCTWRGEPVRVTVHAEAG